ncbi:MAG: outer membrane lipoprotein-sorting protein [Chthoniobacter sp.]|nr:outer membrane lipoprotein-sorting protein [Chthoniobacter sp.]
MKSHIAILLAALGLFTGPLRAEDTPDPRAILKTVRIAQSTQNQALKGEIRTGGKSLPFRLVCAGGIIRYEFTNPTQVLQVRLGDKDTRLEEITDGKTAKVSPRRFDDRVRDTDISYEDLSLCFLYWPTATVQGEQTMLLQKCWIVRVQPGPRGDTQYSKVDLWISKKTGAMMQAEAFDSAGKLSRRFKVISGQSLGDGLWILKEMRIESFGGRSQDRTPTYLDIDKPEN